MFRIEYRSRSDKGQPSDVDRQRGIVAFQILRWDSSPGAVPKSQAASSRCFIKSPQVHPHKELRVPFNDRILEVPLPGFKPGSTIQVHLLFPDRKFILWARVRWAKKVPPQLEGIIAAGMGVQFVEP